MTITKFLTCLRQNKQKSHGSKGQCIPEGLKADMWNENFC